jgi:hypothetical protein
VTPDILNALHLVGRAEMEPLLGSMRQPNSDYYPVLDLGAERRRFRLDHASGFQGLSADWFNLLASRSGRRMTAGVDPLAALPENPRVRARALGALLRSPMAIDLPTNASPLTKQGAFDWRVWQSMATSAAPPVNWEIWLQQAGRADQLRNGGTAGVMDGQFYDGLDRYMDRNRAPEPIRDVVKFRRGLATWNFAEAAAAGERLMLMGVTNRSWISGDELRDGLVMSRLHLQDIKGARQALQALQRFSRRPGTDVRSQLLTAYVESAERGQSVALKR